MFLELFSKRNKQKKETEVYLYNNLPDQFRVQVTYIFKDLFGERGERLYEILQIENIYQDLVKCLARNFGVYYLHQIYKHDNYGYHSEFINGFLSEKNIDKTMDYIELAFRVANNIAKSEEYEDRVQYCGFDSINKHAIDELNYRFDEHALGYQFVEGQIIRRDNTFTHSEIIKPSLEILSRKRFKGASSEFHKAHEHYRNGKNHEALNECLKAFESTMRIICDKQGWNIKSTATASTLIKVCFEKKLIPLFWESKFTSLKTLLESGVPTARNKLSGHGAGAVEKEIPRYIVEYAINMTASTILFLVEAEENL
ncbi:STM4504/CBY_0614 family protein [Acinetobacter sp. 161(2023)]|uniref:STM4504/CBY_0614 family protein n=1 Tax=Acinetobacter sp. 161(2023) TaxID=3098768 RepID=UPI003009EF3F